MRLGAQGRLVLPKPDRNPIRVGTSGLDLVEADRTGVETRDRTYFFKILRMQANHVKSTAFAAEGSGVGIRIDAEVVEKIGLKDLALRLTWV